MHPSKLAVDIMGSDFGPKAIVSGLVAAAIKYPESTFFAVGQPHILSQYFAKKPSNIVLVPAENEIKMNMSVSEASKMGTSSTMGTAISLVAEGKADACLSCGSTASLMALSFRILRMREGIRRPSILSSIHYGNRRIYIADLGANIEPKAEDFLANGILASAYSKAQDPKVVLMNVGKEASKGTALIQEADKLLRESDLNYQGFIEGHDVFTKQHDIILCDGFVGNCLTKFMEGMLAIFGNLVDEPERLPKLNYAALLAGLNGNIYKAHGHSNAQAVTQAIEDILAQEQAIIAA